VPRPRRKSPRRRAKQERARETVEAVIEAAARVLLREGYARATTNRIAEAAGVSVGSLYQYFADKDEVFESLLRRQTGIALEAMVAVGADPYTPLEELLRRILAASLRSHRHGPRIYRQLESLPGDRFRRPMAEANRRLAEYLRGLFEAHREQLRVADLDLATFVAIHAAEGLGLHAPADLPEERLLEEAHALLCRYLLRVPGERRPGRRPAAVGPGVPV
jgi:AcrR family transcriptional regulator